jgi:hypothetical protein
MIEAYVFGYGSLANPDDWIWDLLADDPHYGRLEGFTRTWRMAFDNCSPDRDHKYYVDERGQRYSGAVASLGLVENPFAWVNGVALPVDKAALRLIDQREASGYLRTGDLRQRFNVDLPARLLTYLPTETALRTYRFHLAAGSVALPEDYWIQCHRAFSFLAPDGWDEFLLTTESLGCPRIKLELRRVAGEAGL